MLDHLAAIVFLVTLAVGIGLLWGAYGLIGFGIGGLLTLTRYKK